MNKLIDLLNESEDGFVSKFTEYDNMSGTFRLDNGQSFHYTLILSKEYCFIKRLVENNKIDIDKFSYCRDNFFDTRYYGFSTHQYILMLLSIQDNPVEFLISILK